MRQLISGVRRIGALGGLAGLISVLLVAPASDELHAQTVLGTASLYQSPALGPEQGAAIEPQSGDGAGDRSRDREALRHLPLSRDGWMVEGEIGTLTWRSYLTGAAVASARQFRIAYESAASVLPTISQLALRINGVEIGRTGIAAPSDLALLDFLIPAGVLRHGFNEVAISVDQRHRVDCSPEATYELWTRIDPVRTGFVNGGDSAVSKLTDLAALNPASDGSLAIRVLFDGQLQPQRIDQIVLAAQAIALSGRFERASISFGTDPERSASVNLIVGTAPEVSRLLAVVGARPEVPGPTLLLAPGFGAAPALIATGRSDDDIGRAINQLITIATNQQQVSSEPGRPPARAELKIIGGERIRFEQLGIAHREFSGRRFRLPINLDMPPDMLVADYGRLSINLSGAYAAGLRGDAQVQVQLNGRDAASVPLSKPSGGLFHHNDVVVPLAAMRPGGNVLEITATLPQDSDRSCDNAVSLDKAAPRFLLLGDTEIRFPQIARVGQMPDLGQTMAGGYPYSIPRSRPKLYVPSPDRESMAAAVALAVRLSVVAGHPIRFSLVVANPAPGSGPALVVAPASALDPAMMASIGLDPNAVRLAWQPRAMVQGDQVTDGAMPDRSRPASAHGQGPQARFVPVALHGNSRAEASAIEPGPTDTATQGAPSEVWTDMLHRRSLVDRAAELARLFTDKAAAVAGSAAGLLCAQFGSRLAPSDATIDSATSLIVAQGYRSPESDDIVTIVTAPDAKTLARAVDALVEPAAWSGPRGRLALLSETAAMLQTAPADNIRLIKTEPLSFGNARLIAAGWLSLHPAVYVAAALLLAALLAVTSRALVKNVGRRNS